LNDSEHDFGKNVIPDMVRAGEGVFAWPLEDLNKKEKPYWRDVGTLDSFYEANMDLISVTPQLNLYDEEWPIRTHREHLPPAKFLFSDPDGIRRGQALDSLVSAGAIVSGGTVVRSVLSPSVRVNSYSLVEDSVLLGGVDIGRHAVVKHAIIDKRVRIPPGTRIGCNLDEDRRRFSVTAKGVVVVPKEMVFPS
jgi:glucose-1-phosphate adenylyltransferase